MQQQFHVFQNIWFCCLKTNRFWVVENSQKTGIGFEKTRVRNTIQHLDGRSTNISYLEIGLKPAVFSCLANAIDPLPIALKSCSNPQKIRQAI